MTADATLGGYEQTHGRPPAFRGIDGLAYTAATFVEAAPDAAGRYGAALLFVRWSADGERVDGHVETDYVAFGHTPAEAVAPLLALTLHQVKSHLDALTRSPPAAGRA